MEFESIAYPEFAFSLIGIKGLQKGQVYQVGGDGVFKSPKDSWSLKGYFAPDSQGKYAFLPPDYVQFQMTPGKGTITVGDRECPASSGPKDGIHVLALNRATLEKMSDDVYPLSNLPQTGFPRTPTPSGAISPQSTVSLTRYRLFVKARSWPKTPRGVASLLVPHRPERSRREAPRRFEFGGS
jgi:hypothetical protein